MEEPEIIKMLKYILLISYVIVSIQCYPLVTEKTSVAAVPIHHSGEVYTSVVPSVISDGTHKSVSGEQRKMEDEKNERSGQMSPVDLKDVQEDDTGSNTGGQKRVRQIQEEIPPNNSGGLPPPSDELCSIFQFFLESRRFSRCRVSNTYFDGDRTDVPPGPSPPRDSVELGNRFEFNSNFHRPISNEVAPSPDSSSSNGDNFQSESETRVIENDVHRHRPILQDLPQMVLDDPRSSKQPAASKRYDQLDELQFGPPPGSEDHLGGPPGPPPMFPKSSLDRTTIIVPERPCPRGERRDHKGYCRRIVRVRPNYQYGPPPPPPYGPSRPIRYYYSRFVSVPTLQFFIPSVP